MKFCQYFCSLRKIPSNYIELYSMQRNNFNYIYGKYIVKDISTVSNKIFLRIEKYNQDGLIGTNIWATSSPVGSIDIIINDDEKNICIEWYLIKNRLFCQTHNNMYGEPISENEEHFVRKILFETAENIAITNDYKKIQLKTHQSLKFYNNDGLKELGFNLTAQRAKDNSFWIITEKIL